MSGVLPEGTDVGYYVGGKVISCSLSFKFLFQPIHMLSFIINSDIDDFLEVIGWIYKGTWHLLSLLQYSGKLYYCSLFH